MTLPALPPQGDTSWYDWATGVHNIASGLGLNVKGYGAVGNGTTNDSAAFQAAFNAAGPLNATVMIPPGTYVIDNVGVPVNVRIVGTGSEPYRFGSTGVTLKHLANSTNPCLVLNGGGATLENVTLDGNGATGTVLAVAHGFETRIRQVRIINGGGIGLDIRGAGNASYQDVFVDNCGSSSLPGVLINSNSQAINTLDIANMHIERCAGVHLQIGEVGSAVVPEFIRLINLHIEATTDNGGVNNSLSHPLVHIKRSRSVHIINPFLYGGPGPHIKQEQAGSESGLGGLTVSGGTLLGKSSASGSQPERAIDLVSGSEFSISDTRIDESQYGAIRIGAGYGSRAYIAPTVVFTDRVSAPIEDNRTGTRLPMRLGGDTTVRGHIESEQSSLRPTIAAVPAGAPAPTLDHHTDTKGLLFFGSNASPAAAAQVTVTFNRPYATQPTVVLTPGNADSAGLNAYVASSTTGFTVYARNAPAASQINGTYQFAYIVIG